MSSRAANFAPSLLGRLGLLLRLFQNLVLQLLEGLLELADLLLGRGLLGSSGSTSRRGLLLRGLFEVSSSIFD